MDCNGPPFYFLRAASILESMEPIIIDNKFTIIAGRDIYVKASDLNFVKGVFIEKIVLKSSKTGLTIDMHLDGYEIESDRLIYRGRTTQGATVLFHVLFS